MTESVDALVVGLGPAGASAAAAAARAGLSVLGVDRKREAGVPVQCAEFVPLPLAKHARPAGVLQQRIAGMTSTLSSGTVRHSAFPGLMVDRAAFDRALVNEAVACGAKVMLGTRLRLLRPEGGVATLCGPEGECVVRFRVLIAADGPDSPVAAALGLPPLETVCTRQYTVPLLAPSADTAIWLSDQYPGGYAWLFPRGGVANLGLGLDRAFRRGMKARLDALHRRLVADGRVGRGILHHTGGAIPVGGLRARLVIGPVLFAGDAAGLTHPITGAGIAAAVISGERAGKAAAEALGGHPDALEAYETDMREQFDHSLRRAVARRRWLVSQRRRGAAADDAVQRRAWIAFPEYFEPVA